MQKKKQYLKRYLLQDKKILRLKDRIITDPDNEQDYLAQIKDCELVKKEIEKKISAVEDELLRELLLLKYTSGKRLNEISEIIGYSRRHTERLHIMALEKFNI